MLFSTRHTAFVFFYRRMKRVVFHTLQYTQKLECVFCCRNSERNVEQRESEEGLSHLPAYTSVLFFYTKISRHWQVNELTDGHAASLMHGTNWEQIFTYSNQWYLNISIIKLLNWWSRSKRGRWRYGFMFFFCNILFWDTIQDSHEYKALTNYKHSTREFCNWAENKAIYYISINAGKETAQTSWTQSCGTCA